jgi:hypothetical protein
VKSRQKPLRNTLPLLRTQVEQLLFKVNRSNILNDLSLPENPRKHWEIPFVAICVRAKVRESEQQFP